MNAMFIALLSSLMFPFRLVSLPTSVTVQVINIHGTRGMTIGHVNSLSDYVLTYKRPGHQYTWYEGYDHWTRQFNTGHTFCCDQTVTEYR